jgi:hypothetical protein
MFTVTVTDYLFGHEYYPVDSFDTFLAGSTVSRSVPDDPISSTVL